MYLVNSDLAPLSPGVHVALMPAAQSIFGSNSNSSNAKVLGHLVGAFITVGALSGAGGSA